MTTTRRQLLTAALATGIALPLSAGRTTAAPPRLTLPRPTGPHPIGTTPLHLINGTREITAAIWYPATPQAHRYPAETWLAAEPLRRLLADNDFGPDAALAPHTAGHIGAPAQRTRQRRPVILYSHGNNSHRSEATILIQELASHGYVVATADHTGDGYSQYPDGRLALPTDDDFDPWDSAADMRLLLGKLDDIAAGRNPDAQHRPLPTGLATTLDTHRVGMLGWSKGATSTALLMSENPRIHAGISIDGPLQAVPPIGAVRQPIMLMTAEFNRTAEPGIDDLWHHRLLGWKLNIQADGAAHSSYIDHQWLIPQLARAIDMSDEDLTSWIGTLDPARALRIQRAYPRAFFDQHLRHQRQRLLEGPSRAFPEVRHLP